MDQLLGMGFAEPEAKKALEAAGGDANRAVELILNPESMQEAEVYHVEDYHGQSHFDHHQQLQDHNPYIDIIQRGPQEPGIISSTRSPELGSLMTILNCNFWVQQALSEVAELEWTNDWWYYNTQTQPQSIVQELAKQCAFLHMHCGRAQADSALLERALGNREFSSLEDFLGCLEPLRSLYTIHKNQLVLKVDEVYGDLCSHADRMLVGQDITVPPILMLEIEQADNLRVSEHWYPERHTNAFSELNTKVKLKLNDYDEELSKIRRNRLQLRAFKGSDVLEMLRSSSNIIKEYQTQEGTVSSSETTATLDKLGEQLGSSRNHLMDKQQALSEERSKLAQMYTQMDPQVFSLLGVQPQPVHRYDATGILISSQEYYTRYDGQWFYVNDNMPSACSFNTARDACQDQSELLVVYSRIPEVDKLEPSDAIREFCLNELDAMSLTSTPKTPTPDTSMSPSNKESTSASEESEMMDAVDRGPNERAGD